MITCCSPNSFFVSYHFVPFQNKKNIFFFPKCFCMCFILQILKQHVLYIVYTVSTVVSSAWIHEFMLLCGFKISLMLRSSSAAADPHKDQDFRMHVKKQSGRPQVHLLFKINLNCQLNSSETWARRFFVFFFTDHPEDMCSPRATNAPFFLLSLGHPLAASTHSQ